MSVWSSIKEELEAIAAGGVLHPADVVEAARNPNSAMHNQFEWDDSEAAEAYRLQQARALIRRVKVNVVRSDQEVVHIPSFTRLGSAPGYVETQVIVGATGQLAAAILTLTQCATMLRNLGMPEMDSLIASIERTKAELSALLRKSEAV
jgi:hypothetical protein